MPRSERRKERRHKKKKHVSRKLKKKHSKRKRSRHLKSKGSHKSESKVSCCGKRSKRSMKKKERTKSSSVSSRSATHSRSSKTVKTPTVHAPRHLVKKSRSIDSSQSLTTRTHPQPNAIGVRRTQERVGSQSSATTNSDSTFNSSVVMRNVTAKEPTQELCISQYVKGGNEYSKWTYVTMFPVGEKPEYIYMPRIRRSVASVSSSGTKERDGSWRNRSLSSSSNRSKEQALSKSLPVYVFNQLSTCTDALKRARGNLGNLKVLAGKVDQTDVKTFDTDTEMLIGKIKRLGAVIETIKPNVK